MFFSLQAMERHINILSGDRTRNASLHNNQSRDLVYLPSTSFHLPPPHCSPQY
ncbi:hypothetical protein C8Q74DRAFT_1249468 [Fomes fomentarius]|nr:hypothetical protein C8Q74DRAFT_1249468 [Fomes fomentarius]